MKKKKKRKRDHPAQCASLIAALPIASYALAHEVGVSRRMMTYYESQSAHPPTHLLTEIARALRLSTDELLGATPIKKAALPANSRLQRRLHAIEKLDAKEKRQVLQLLDAFIERGQLKRKVA